MTIIGSKKAKHAAILIYVPLFFGIWAAWEFFGAGLVDRTVGNGAVSALIRDGAVKNLVWTLPAVLLILCFRDGLLVRPKEMITNRVIILKYLPIYLLFAVYIIAAALLQKGRISINGSFGVSNVISVLFVGATEETVFRGWLLNATVSEKRKTVPIIVNAVLFVLVHFPIWIVRGEFIGSFTSLGFLCVFTLSIVFSVTFIKSGNILIPITLHMWWDLLVELFV